jgi:hypothetical protein
MDELLECHEWYTKSQLDIPMVSISDQPVRVRAVFYLPVGHDPLVYTTGEFEKIDQASPGLKWEILRGSDL